MTDANLESYKCLVQRHKSMSGRIRKCIMGQSNRSEAQNNDNTNIKDPNYYYTPLNPDTYDLLKKNDPLKKFNNHYLCEAMNFDKPSRNLVDPKTIDLNKYSNLDELKKHFGLLIDKNLEKNRFLDQEFDSSGFFDPMNGSNPSVKKALDKIYVMQILGDNQEDSIVFNQNHFDKHDNPDQLKDDKQKFKYELYGTI